MSRCLAYTVFACRLPCIDPFKDRMLPMTSVHLNSACPFDMALNLGLASALQTLTPAPMSVQFDHPHAPSSYIPTVYSKPICCTPSAPPS